MNTTAAVLLISVIVAVLAGAGLVWMGIEIGKGQCDAATLKIEAQDTKAAAKGNQDLASTDQKIDALRNQPAPTVHYEKDTDCLLPSAAVLLLKRP